MQDARKAAGLRIEDTIALYTDGVDEDVAAMLTEYGSYVRGETLATELSQGAAPDGAYTATTTLGGASLTLGLAVTGRVSGGVVTRHDPDEGDEA